MRDGWTETTFGDIASWSSGKNLSSDKRKESGLIPILGANGIIGHTDEVLLDVELITVGRVGACGETHRSSGPVWVSDNALIVLPTEQVNIEFLFYKLSTFNYQSIISGTTQPLITQTKMKSQVVNLPSLEKQKQIVDVVSSVDAYIDSLQQQADSARTARNAVLHELLSAGGDDWTETTLGEVALLNPKEPALSADSPFIPMDAVHVGKRYVQYHEPRGDRSGARANTGDVLFARITPCLENGKVAQIQDGIERCGGSTEFIVIRGTNAFGSDFAYFWATWSDTRNRTAGLMTGTTGRQRLSASDLGAMTISLPPMAEQQQIAEIVSSMDDVIQSTEQAVADAKNLRSGLLSDLLSGEHEIPASYNKLIGAA
jgi:type I restriction enzyme S subunit